ncbi:MAG: histidine phosphatase family protein, partial [Firmicutes bacterium]|nr:histidine phosphatase family protein [Bacillota bacterium]
MRLIFVRHGETLWNRQLKIQGKSDVPLSEKGVRQAQL